MPTCALLAIGNELLNGEIRDSNLYVLSRTLTQIGFSITNAAIAPDEPMSIHRTISFLLDPAPQLLICTGGLGPTQDDLTLEALAETLQRPLEPHDEARHLVERHYDRLLSQGYLLQRGPETARAKMACLPRGAKSLPNPIGTAPGVEIMHDATLIYVLPGVPAEMEAIFAASIVPALQQRFELGIWAQGELRIHCDDEADVAQPLEVVRRHHTDVYIKTLAQPFPAASAEGLRVIATTQNRDAAAAQDAVDAALADLRETMEAAGFQVTAA